MYGTKSQHGIKSVDGISPRMIRSVLVLGLAVMFFLGMTQTGFAQGFDVCADAGSNFTTMISNLITLIIVGAVMLGTIAIILGFAAESAPFLDAKYSDWKKKGLVYGWGIVVLLYFLKFGSGILGINIDCMFPI